MKSVKPGRGPSRLSFIVGLFMIGFGILWTILASQLNIVFLFFGIIWTGIATVITVYHYRNATSNNRYSTFDITEENEEPDPLNQQYSTSQPIEAVKDNATRFCPYCGTSVQSDFEFCRSCGKKLP